MAIGCRRRRRALGQAIHLVRQAVVQRLDHAQDPQCIIDSLPIPGVQFYDVPQANRDWKAAGATFGHCCSKKPAIFGYNLHLLLIQGEGIRDVELAPTNVTDLTAGVEWLECQSDLQALADKGYLSQPLAQEWCTRHHIMLLTVPRRNQRARPDEAGTSCHSATTSPRLSLATLRNEALGELYSNLQKA